MKTDLFQSCGHCWVFQIFWHNECSTFTASSFRVWNSSTGIPSPLLAWFIVMLSKAHLTSHSRMSGSRLVITSSWLSGSWRSLLYSSSVYSCHLFLISFASVRCYVVNTVNDKEYYMDWKWEKCLFTISPFFSQIFWKWSCLIYSYNFDIIWYIIYQYIVSNILSHCVGCLFVALMISLLCKSFLVWYNPICLFFILLPLSKETMPKNFASAMSKNTLSKFLPGILWFVVSY